jgi:hypothetical protein
LREQLRGPFLIGSGPLLNTEQKFYNRLSFLNAAKKARLPKLVTTARAAQCRAALFFFIVIYEINSPAA